METKGDVAFALGGLAGNNAHGAGFLQAALDLRIRPTMISCTSGQLRWVYQYLKALADLKQHRKPEHLRERMQAQVQAAAPFEFEDWNVLRMMLSGVQGVCKPVWWEFWKSWYCNTGDLWLRACVNQGKVFWAKGWLETWPCRLSVPVTDDGFFEKAAAVMGDSEIGIVFNSYDPTKGHEHVYLNRRARELTGGNKTSYKPRAKSSYHPRTQYHDIDAEAVQKALWLYNYGFDDSRNRDVDGAYYREIILSELTCVKTIFVVRPINRHWIGAMPKNYPELEDLKTEVGFNGSYAGERGQVALMNKLLRDGELLNRGLKYHDVSLREIESEDPRGYYDYAFESMDVFDDAYRMAMRELSDWQETAGEAAALGGGFDGSAARARRRRIGAHPREVTRRTSSSVVSPSAARRNASEGSAMVP